MRNIIYITLFFLCNNLVAQSITNDQSYLDNDFWEFKIRLANCTIKKDKVALSELLSDKVLDCWDAYDCAGFSGCDKENFIQMFFDNEKSENWDILKKIVQFGFHRTIDTTKYKHINKKRDSIVFSGPSFLKKTLDKKSTKIFVIAENLNLRTNPSINSKILKTISYGEYSCETEENGYVSVYFGNQIEWIKLTLSDGSTGYVSRKFTSEYLDRTVTIAKIDGEWLIISYFCHLDI